MLNYISAEWYKLRHTKGIFIAFGLLLALILVIFLPKFWLAAPTFRVYAAAYAAFLPVGFFLAPIFAARVFDDQYSRGTMKNEVVFGISRWRIYLGKLTMAALTGTGAAFIVLAFYLLMCLLGHGAGEEDILLYVDFCIQWTLLTVPLWLASLSLAFCLQVIVKSSGGALALDYMILIIGAPIAMIGTDEPTTSHILNFFNRWFFVAPFRTAYMSLDGEWNVVQSMEYSCLMGLGWIIVTSLVGMAVFSRREIN